MQVYDAIVIGAGVSGCAIARELSMYGGRFAVIEREEDVCAGTTKANSAIVHAGFDAQPGSLMAQLNVEGSRRMPRLCKELGVDYDPIGALVVCTAEEMLKGLYDLQQRGKDNGVDELEVIDRKRLVELEPHISEEAVGALFAPTSAVVNPFQLCHHLADCAAQNGVEFFFDSPVKSVEKLIADDGKVLWCVRTSECEYRTRAVVNAAGVYADVIHNWVSTKKLTITPRRGQYYVLDKSAGTHVNHTIFSLPTKLGKGVLVTPTTGGNLLVGPNAEDITEKEGTDTTAEGLFEVKAKSAMTVKDIPFWDIIATFSGLRAHQPDHDFVIGEVPEAPGFIDCAAIESPGLSSAPAIGHLVAQMVQEMLSLPENPSFNPYRPKMPDLLKISEDDWQALIDENPAYGQIVCRCNRVSEAQIVAAITSPVGARSLDGVKRRTEACMGRCQAGFCTPKILDLLAQWVPGLTIEKTSKAGTGSEIFYGLNKGQLVAPFEAGEKCE